MTDAVMTVQRVEHGNGSHIEPPLDASWSNLDKLRWHCAVLKADTGLDVSVTFTDKRGSDTDPKWYSEPFGYYSLTYRDGGCGPFDFHTAWTYVSAISLGVRLSRRELS